MIQRIGNVLYWGGCIVAGLFLLGAAFWAIVIATALFGLFGLSAADIKWERLLNPFFFGFGVNIPQCLFGATVAWTLGRAAQYVLAGSVDSHLPEKLSAGSTFGGGCMGLSDIFPKKPKTAWDALNENPIFQQQKELFEAMSLMCEDGVDADEMPNGQGEFGITPSNPIPCKTVFGSTAYLGRLRTSDGAKVVYERAGSVSSDVSPHPVDAYEISHPNGQKLATLFISPYQNRISGKAPAGFKLADIAFS